MQWLFDRFLTDVKEIYAANETLNNTNSHDAEIAKLCKTYGKLAEVHIKNGRDYGDVFTNESFARMVGSGFIISADGICYYVGADLIETKERIDFDANTIRSKADKYPYVFWYNK